MLIHLLLVRKLGSRLSRARCPQAVALLASTDSAYTVYYLWAGWLTLLIFLLLQITLCLAKKNIAVTIALVSESTQVYTVTPVIRHHAEQYHTILQLVSEKLCSPSCTHSLLTYRSRYARRLLSLRHSRHPPPQPPPLAQPASSASATCATRHLQGAIASSLVQGIQCSTVWYSMAQ